MKWNFLYQITVASRLGGYRPQIPVLFVLCPQLNLLNPPPKKIPVYATGTLPPGSPHRAPTENYAPFAEPSLVVSSLAVPSYWPHGTDFLRSCWSVLISCLFWKAEAYIFPLKPSLVSFFSQLHPVHILALCRRSVLTLPTSFNDWTRCYLLNPYPANVENSVSS